MTITRLKLERFTAFESLDLEPSPGVNVLVGANGTGKTHLMKVAYAACDVSKTETRFAEKLVRVFMPSKGSIGRLVKRRKFSSRCAVHIHRRKFGLRISFSNHATKTDAAKVIGASRWSSVPVESVYIPAKEILANAPGFRSLYKNREVHFEEVYSDILDRAYRPALRGAHTPERRHLLRVLQKGMEGKVHADNEEFFLRNKRGNIEFSLLAEGLRKLGLLWLLIQNGTFLEGTVLFWDDPETNLNPKLFGTAVNIMIELQRMGVQVFVATHDYAILKEFDLRREKKDNIIFHSLYRDPESDEIAVCETDDFLDIRPNPIAEAFDSLYDRQVVRSLSEPESWPNAGKEISK